MNHHEKGMLLSQKVQGVVNTPHSRRIARRMLRVWARHWDERGDSNLARAMRKDAANLH